MPASLVTQAHQSDTLASTRTVNKPGTVAAGDVAALFLHRWDSGGSFPAVTAPGGGVTQRGITANGPVQTIAYLDYVQAESAWAFTWTGTRWSSLAALFFRGVDASLDLAQVPFQVATGTGTAVSTINITTVADAALAWAVNTHDYTSATTHVPPTGYTEVIENNAHSAAYKIAGGSAESAANATISNSQVWIACLLGLAPAGGAAPPRTDQFLAFF